MALDHLVGLPADPAAVRDATDRTHRWLARCIDAFADHGGEEQAALFGICQGGMDPELRRESAAAIASAAVAGCAIGGLSVGEPKPVMAEMLEIVAEILPVEQTEVLDGRRFTRRPLDGCGAGGRSLRLRPADPVGAQRSVVHSRQDASTSSSAGSLMSMRRWTRNATATPVPGSAPPISTTCFARAKFSDLRLASVHNLRFLANQIEAIRQAIEQNAFASAHASFLSRYRPVGHALNA